MALAATVIAGSATTQRVSVTSSGEQANGVSYESAISADGRYVAFDSLASNLVPGDTNQRSDVFVRDRKLDTTERVSVDANGNEGNGDSFEAPAISGDGRYVAFDSEASNLVPADTNGSWDVFVRDRKLDTTKRVSVTSTGHQGNRRSIGEAISADGRYVAFQSRSKLVAGDTNHVFDIFVRDRKRHTTRRVSVSSSGHEGNGRSDWPVISAGGRYVNFASDASNLVAGDTNHAKDEFVRDRKLHKTRRVSVSSAGRQANSDSFDSAISADGRYVAFTSFASTLDPDPRQRNGGPYVYVRDRKRHTTKWVSVSSNGEPSNGATYQPAISDDGRYLAFGAQDPETGREDDVYVRDRKRDVTRRVSVSSNGEPSNGATSEPAISADGRYVAFVSDASNLVPGDTNPGSDVFVHGPLP